MKKIKKNDLRLDKEVISSLTVNDLGNVKGGGNNTVAPCKIDPVHPISWPDKDQNHCMTPIPETSICQTANKPLCLQPPVSGACADSDRCARTVQSACGCPVVIG